VMGPSGGGLGEKKCVGTMEEVGGGGRRGLLI
jgi:hypothetical protein